MHVRHRLWRGARGHLISAPEFMSSRYARNQTETDSGVNFPWLGRHPWGLLMCPATPVSPQPEGDPTAGSSFPNSYVTFSQSPAPSPQFPQLQNGSIAAQCPPERVVVGPVSSPEQTSQPCLFWASGMRPQWEARGLAGKGRPGGGLDPATALRLPPLLPVQVGLGFLWARLAVATLGTAS